MTVKANFEQNPRWTTVECYHAETDVTDKITRIANDLAFGGAVIGAISWMFGPVGFVYNLCLAATARKTAGVLLGYAANPIAVKTLLHRNNHDAELSFERKAKRLRDEYHFVKRIQLVKSGTRYDAVLLGSNETRDNGKWTVCALRSGSIMEEEFLRISEENDKFESNTLIVNGPSVGKSGGWPTRYQLGAGLEAGLQFLEKEVMATHIVMRGVAFGAGMMAEAILQHDFPIDGNYLAISDRCFSRHTDAATAAPFFVLSGMELDAVAASAKLSDMNVRHIVIQHAAKTPNGSDGVIPDKVSLAYALENLEITEHKRFLVSSEVIHDGPLPDDRKEELEKEIHDFFGNSAYTESK